MPDISGEPANVTITGARIELVAENPLVAREWLARIADPEGVGEEYVRLLGESYRQEENWSGGIGALMRLQPRLKDTPLLAAQAIEADHAEVAALLRQQTAAEFSGATRPAPRRSRVWEICSWPPHSGTEAVPGGSWMTSSSRPAVA